MTDTSIAVRWAAATDVGLHRERNEDAYLILREAACAVLADGMGGHRGGDVAAGMVVDGFARAMRARRPDAALTVDGMAALLRDVVGGCNAAVHQAARAERGLSGMGATVVAFALCADGLVHAAVGDSRLYRLRGAVLQQLSHDHTMLQDLVDSGMISHQQAARAPFRGMLTRALGVEAGVEVDVACADVRPGDLLLLCSDGLTDMVPDATIAAVLGEPGSLGERAAALIDLANFNGGRDNVTVVLAAIEERRRRDPSAVQ